MRRCGFGRFPARSELAKIVVFILVATPDNEPEAPWDGRPAPGGSIRRPANDRRSRSLSVRRVTVSLVEGSNDCDEVPTVQWRC